LRHFATGRYFAGWLIPSSALTDSSTPAFPPWQRAPEISSLASRIVEVVGAPYDIKKHLVIIGSSIGIAVAPDDGTDPDQLLKNADMALYRAKADGRGTYRFFLRPEWTPAPRCQSASNFDPRIASADNVTEGGG
jgi:hypothetical protein